MGYPDDCYEKWDISKDIYSVRQMGLVKTNGIVEIREKKGEIIHVVSTIAGQSGGPIILIEGEKLSMIGIHKGGITTKIKESLMKANSGKFLNEKLIKLLTSEAENMKAEMFKTRT